jgi:DNA-binding winged helix-turn-helix (wHTH) protein
VPLRAKVFDTLRVLVENHGRLAAKEALVTAVWPDTLVEDGNLAHNVAALRKALGSGETRSDHVETIPGQGYRLVAPITAIRDSAQSESLPESGAPRSDVSWDKRLDDAVPGPRSASLTIGRQGTHGARGAVFSFRAASR